ncbi:FAD-dependent oxidoreductase [Candidatus Methylocalor cossyra]|uniref:Squalene monooxygenase n=1 Tax=Candidatus Methylocalor cossyra TaxID=3108543 RepID=A0ABM9NGW0_9GAMM
MQEDLIEGDEWDVLIAGGGVAGAATAAALAPLGLKILVVEPGPSQARRLAGELIHPPGIDGLRQLGLLAEGTPLGAPVHGFAVFPFSEGADAAMLLPYGAVREHRTPGYAIEHRLLKAHLLAQVQSLPGVTVWLGARVVGMERDPGPAFRAVVRHGRGQTALRARLVVGADGPRSPVRKLIGIPHQTQRYSGMLGVEVADTHLPHGGYGNIFLTPTGVAYAYGIGAGRARVMFEVLKGADPGASIRVQLGAFPVPFRRDVERALAAGKPLAAANFCIIPDGTVKANVALVGDARGCCHPLTASGITAAVKDALILRDALCEAGFDVTLALRRYARLCGRLQLTRRTLAEELREAFLAETPETLLLSQCIFAYWRASPGGRIRSMALLSSLDNSLVSLAWQYTLVALQAFRLLPRWLKSRTLGSWCRGLLKFFHKSLKFQQAALRQRVEERLALGD